MITASLSRREGEIIELAIQGHTNEGIAIQLGLSVGTVNTYWLRIRLKVGGFGRTDTVVKVMKKVIQERAEEALKEAKVDCQKILEFIFREPAFSVRTATLAPAGTSDLR